MNFKCVTEISADRAFPYRHGLHVSYPKAWNVVCYSRIKGKENI